MEFITDQGPVVLLLCVLIGPFVQEDAAVIFTAGASAAGLAPWYVLFTVLMIGLIASDSWKYWIGHFARDHRWAQRFITGKGTSKLKPQLTTHLAKTLMVVRFIPLTRVPAYIGAGLFGANIWIFEFYIILSGLIYVILTFLLFHFLGAALGEEVKKYFPLIGLALASIMLSFAYIRHRMSKKAPLNDPDDGQV